MDGLNDVLQSLQPRNEDYSSRLKSLFSSEAYLDLCRKVFGPRSGGFSTVCHGSPWQEHCLVWSEGDSVSEVVLTNYQHARHCPPASDLALLLYTSTSKHQRQQHVSTWLRSYHRTLSETLTTLGHHPDQLYPFSQLFQDYQVDTVLCTTLLIIITRMLSSLLWVWLSL